MSEWNLREHGDGVELKWWSIVGPNFPNYEVFWREHIVPLTCRVICLSNIRLRPSLPKHLSVLATSHYAVFRHLARSHDMLASSKFSASGSLVYEFYSRLWSVEHSTNKFHNATNEILRLYDRVHIPDIKARVGRFGDSDFAREYDDTFEAIKGYRHYTQHQYEPITVDGKVPKVEKLEAYDDLVVLSRLLAEKNRDQILNEDFVDAHIQGTTDLVRLENLLNRIWAVILREFEEMRDLKKYRVAQAKVTEDDIAFCRSMTLRISGDSPGLSGSEGGTSGSGWV